MKNKKKISEPASMKLSEALEMLSGRNTRSQTTDEEKEKYNDEKNDYTIQITFLKKKDDLG